MTGNRRVLTAALLIVLAMAFAGAGCSDKTGTPENQKLTKQRQEMIQKRKDSDTM